MSWRCEAVSFTYPDAPTAAVDDVTLELEPGRCTAVLGPNGSGKSTLLRLLLGTLRPDAGNITFDRRPLTEWTREELARRIGAVAQTEEIAFPITVRQFVAMGRYPHLGPWRSESGVDRAAIAEALRICEVEHLKDRQITNLSGGERQRARIARALAQEPSTFALDEPTVALDVRHEMQIFELLRSLRSGGATVLLITHNLDLAARYADRLVLMHRGRVAADGKPDAVMRPDVLEPVYGWPIEVVQLQGSPRVIPISGGARRGGRNGVIPGDTTHSQPSTSRNDDDELI